MIRAAIIFFVIALVAYMVGAYGIAGMSMEIGRVLLWVFLLLAGISLVLSLVIGKNPK